MRISIKHETKYAYDDPVRSAIQLLRLTPRSSDAQFVRRWRVSLDADARLYRGEDAFGNVTHTAFIEGPFDVLHILVEGDVETQETSGFISGTVERQSERLFLRETALTLASREIRSLVKDCVASEGGDQLAGLHRINHELHRSIKFKVGVTTTATTAAEAFKRKEGVCQDFANIFLSACRAAGLPARYVSGYYMRTDRVEQDAGHAWAEVHVAGTGWIAFDPTLGSCATERHVRVAVGCDSNDAAPIRGSRSGGTTEALSVSITVAEGRSGSGSRVTMVQRQRQR